MKDFFNINTCQKLLMTDLWTITIPETWVQRWITTRYIRVYWTIWSNYLHH